MPEGKDGAWNTGQRRKLWADPCCTFPLRTGNHLPVPAREIIAIGQLGAGIFSLGRFVVSLYAIARFAFACSAIARISLVAHKGCGQVISLFRDLLNFSGPAAADSPLPAAVEGME